jgi:MOSC domain-containing protein YiiM
VQSFLSGFSVVAGDLGENITTRGLDLLSYPVGTRLSIGPTAIVELTGLRNPCAQLDNLQAGLLAAVLDRDSAGNLVRKAGVMAIVLADGPVCPNDAILVQVPAGPHTRLGVV